MINNTQKNKILIQKYIDQSILPDELRQLQQLLTQDATFRNDFLQYIQVDISIEDMILFHNYMDAPNSLTRESLTNETRENKKEQNVSNIKNCETNLSMKFPSRFHQMLQNFMSSLCSLPKM